MAIPSFGQSKKKVDKYLTNNWVSAAKTYETGDTIQKLTERLNLEKKGKMNAKFDGMELSGTWKYLEDTRQLELTISMDGRSEATLFDIDQSSDQVLVITRRRGETFMTIIFVEKGSGLVYETVKVPEKSFDEILTESRAKENSDLGYSPPGEVLKRYDFTKIEEVYDNGSGSSGENGIVYLMHIENEKRIVVIRGQNGAPEEWDVINEEVKGDQTIYNCILHFDYKTGKGKKTGFYKNANFTFTESKVIMYAKSERTREYISE